MGIRNTRMMARALEQRWPITHEFREGIVRRLMKIVVDPTSSRREVTAASKALLAAEAQNQSDEHKVIDVRVQTRHDELAGIAADLGIEVGAIEDAERQADCGIGGAEVKSRPDANQR
jgi:hypothetical protein